MTSQQQQQTLLHVLVIAHPDDESMFFLPTIQSLLASGETLWLLCLTTGDYDGLGKQRTKELERAGKLLGFQKVIIKDDLKDHPTERWETSLVSSAIQGALAEEQPDAQTLVLLTFDSVGVSGHVNHIDTHLGVCDIAFNNNIVIKNNKQQIMQVEAWQLESEQNLVAKFCPFLSWVFLILSIVSQQFHSVAIVKIHYRLYRWNEPWLNWKAMATHESQFVWYRRLFVVFSCYTYVNKLCPIKSKQSTVKQ
jgi:N-acetylglucosaminylphosphatidylinositol deacetylase